MKINNYKNTLFACYMGYITHAIVLNFLPIIYIVFQTNYGISYSGLGNLVLINFVTQIMVDIFGARNIDKIGYRRAIIPAHILAGAGLVGLGILPQILSNAYFGMVISVILFSIGGGLIEVVISPVVDSLPSEDDSAAMSFLHSFYCWGQLLVVLITTLILKIFGYGAWWIMSILWALVPIINIFNFMKVPLPPTVKQERTPIKELFKSNTFRLGLLLMLGAGAAELTMSQWASIFAQNGLKVSKVMGDLLGPCLFALFMAIGRTWYGVKGQNMDLWKSLFASAVLCIACYALTVFTPNPIFSLFACALTGFSVSLMWPGSLSYSAENFPGGGAAMFGIMAVFGDIGCSIGPWLTGVVSEYSQEFSAVKNIAADVGISVEQIGLKTGILSGIIFPVLIIIGLLAVKKKR